MAAQLFRDATTEVEITAFYEGERGRNGLRHGLRLQAVAKSWSETKRIAEEMVPGAESTKWAKYLNLITKQVSLFFSHP